MEETIAQVFEELNFPSAPLLKQALRQRGISFTSRAVDELVKREASRQVQAPAPQPTGKVAADRLHDVWFADLIDLTAAPTDDGEKYILVAQDVFSREIWTRALKSKRPADTQAAFEDILREAGRTPENLVTDKGGEFEAGFRSFAEERGIKVRVKSSMRHISTLDSAIGSLKRAMARDARRAKTDDWAERLDKVTDGQNKLPKEVLDGKAPAAVEGDATLQRKLERKNAEFHQHNREEIQNREAALQAAGRFRIMLNRPVNFSRGFKPRWSDDVHVVATTDFDEVTDTQGRTYKTKFTLPVEGAGETAPTRMERSGSAQVENKQRRALESFASTVEEHFGAGTTVSLARVGQFLKTLPNFREASLGARLNMSAPVAAFLRVFPEKFTVRTGPNSSVRIRPPLIDGGRRLRRGAG